MPPKVELDLYVSAGSRPSQRACENLARLLADYDPADVVWRIREVARDPSDARASEVEITPTTVLRGRVRAHLVGDLRDTDELITLLRIAEVRERPGAGRGAPAPAAQVAMHEAGPGRPA